MSDWDDLKDEAFKVARLYLKAKILLVKITGKLREFILRTQVAILKIRILNQGVEKFFDKNLRSVDG